MVVPQETGNDNVRLSGYSWGAYGRTSLGVRCFIDELQDGEEVLQVRSILFDPDKQKRTVRVEGNISGPGLRSRSLHLTRNNDYAESIDTQGEGIYTVRLRCTGAKSTGWICIQSV